MELGLWHRLRVVELLFKLLAPFVKTTFSFKFLMYLFAYNILSLTFFNQILSPYGTIYFPSFKVELFRKVVHSERLPLRVLPHVKWRK